MAGRNNVLVSAILFIMSIGNIQAQPFVDIAAGQIQRISDDNNISIQYGLNIFLPIKAKNENIFLVGVSYGRLSFELKGDNNPDINLSATSIQLGMVKKWNDKWRTLALIIPKISSDFGELSVKDYQLGGTMLMTKTVNNTFSYKFGLYYNREFFGHFFIPLIGVEWKLNDRVNIFGVLPGNMNMEYRLKENFYSGIAYKSLTTSYRLSEKMQNKYIRDGHKIWGHNQLKAFINFYPAKKLLLFGEIGHTVFREFNIFDDGSKTPLENNDLSEFNDGIFVNFGIALRIRLDNEN